MLYGRVPCATAETRMPHCQNICKKVSKLCRVHAHHGHMSPCVDLLLQGFLPTLLEDAPDMAVKFAVYETARTLYCRMHNDRQVSD